MKRTLIYLMILGTWVADLSAENLVEDLVWQGFSVSLIPDFSAAEQREMHTERQQSLYILRNEPENEEARLATAAITFSLGKYSRAAELYREVLASAGYHRQAAQRYVQSLYLSGDPSTALFVIANLRTQGHDLLMNRVLEGEILYQKRRYSLAVRTLTLVLSELAEIPKSERSAAQKSLYGMVKNNLAISLDWNGDQDRAQRLLLAN